MIGILGGGQLARMLALAGLPLGERFAALDPSEDAGVRSLAHLIVGSYEDPAALEWLSERCDVVTHEFERVPASSARRIAERTPVHPNPDVLEVAQDRITEKELFTRLGLATPPFIAVSTRAQLDAAVDELGFPAVVKLRREGYDGKGQFVVDARTELDTCWKELGGKDLIAEAMVDFDRELSMLAARSTNGETVFYPIVENVHRKGILRLSRAPAPALAPDLQSAAESHAHSVMTELDYVGVLAIELFQVGDKLLGNEMAPRVHNSGHWTIEGAVTSQFANHLRAITGRPLGSTQALGHAAMVNLIGVLPDLDEVLRIEGAHLHLYDKHPRGQETRPRNPGRGRSGGAGGALGSPDGPGGLIGRKSRSDRTGGEHVGPESDFELVLVALVESAVARLDPPSGVVRSFFPRGLIGGPGDRVGAGLERLDRLGIGGGADLIDDIGLSKACPHLGHRRIELVGVFDSPVGLGDSRSGRELGQQIAKRSLRLAADVDHNRT